jgi:hypothetical protein
VEVKGIRWVGVPAERVLAMANPVVRAPDGPVYEQLPLDVTDRRDAVRRGRGLHLLNPGLRSR